MDPMISDFNDIALRIKPSRASMTWLQYRIKKNYTILAFISSTWRILEHFNYWCEHAFVILVWEGKIEYLWGILYNQHCMIIMVRSDVDVPIIG